ncbi:hypothetical protein VdG1_06093 [Verticillium dahliae VDG1]|nr:hypothetical protein VdG1_06093 [Verticillium dahliae VDG1]
MILTRAELLPYKEGIYLWKYVPSLALSIIFLSIFGVLSLAHTWRMFQHRLWFCLPFVVGGYLEATGCVGRVIARNDTSGLMPYIIQSIFLLVPPSLFAASIYMVLGRIIRGLGPRAVALSIIRPTWLTKVFFVGDISAFVIQAGGAGMTTSATQKDLGNTTVIVGLCVQIAFFGLFVLAAVIFDLMMMLYATSALILVRCTFRIIDYIMGPEGYLLSNEWPLFVFDLTLMALIKPFPVTDPVGFELATETKKKRSLVGRRTSGGVV